MNKNLELRDHLSSLEALLNVTIKLADRHGLDEIRVSKTRAREIQREVNVLRKAFEAPARRTASLDAYLDAVTQFDSAQA